MNDEHITFRTFVTMESLHKEMHKVVTSSKCNRVSDDDNYLIILLPDNMLRLNVDNNTYASDIFGLFESGEYILTYGLPTNLIIDIFNINKNANSGRLYEIFKDGTLIDMTPKFRNDYVGSL